MLKNFLSSPLDSDLSFSLLLLQRLLRLAYPVVVDRQPAIIGAASSSVDGENAVQEQLHELLRFNALR
ncbi:hypothetical protein K0U00_37140, partial [Paenibacillus sepulcri]|nr:hypothetical protein [Paenibacillus sepulcri]